MKKIISIILVILLLCLSMGLSGCKKDTSGTIRLSEVTHSIFYTPQYLALALGYFEEVGLTIELSNAGGADNVMTALLTNEADLGLMGPEPGIYVYLQGKLDYPIVVGQLTKRDGSFLVGRTNETDFDWSKLANKEILMGRKGGMPAMILQYILNKKGYTNGKNITMNYDIQFNLLAPAFTGGTADYVPLFEPTASQLVAEGKGYIVSSIGRESGEIPYTCYLANKSYIKANGEKITKFLSCIYKAYNYLATHDNKEIADLISPYFIGTSKEIIISALDNYKAYDAWASTPIMQESSYTKLQDVLENAGELARRVNFTDMVDNSMAKNAVK